MAGIYIHIPFCKQACHYCDFHFSTNTSRQQDMVDAICVELETRKNELPDHIATIYFGGGTPSLLSAQQLEQILNCIRANYSVVQEVECTLEANPDDISEPVLRAFKAKGVNRISLGIQSFFESDLTYMNRAHSAQEAHSAIGLCLAQFTNVSIDLIYGITGMSTARWQENLDLAMSYNVPHLSCYALTVEPGTALAHFIKTGKEPKVDESLAAQHYEQLLSFARTNGFINYEFSNFGKEGFWSKNNAAYWQGKPYLGIGPGAHSFIGTTRSWNVSSNPKYIKAFKQGQRPFDSEELTLNDRYNEYLMTGLRTIWGVSLTHVSKEFGEAYFNHLKEQIKTLPKQYGVALKDNTLRVRDSSKFFTDGIAAHLFRVL